MDRGLSDDYEWKGELKHTRYVDEIHQMIREEAETFIGRDHGGIGGTITGTPIESVFTQLPNLLRHLYAQKLCDAHVKNGFPQRKS